MVNQPDVEHFQLQRVGSRQARPGRQHRDNSQPVGTQVVVGMPGRKWSPDRRALPGRREIHDTDQGQSAVSFLEVDEVLRAPRVQQASVEHRHIPLIVGGAGTVEGKRGDWPVAILLRRCAVAVVHNFATRGRDETVGGGLLGSGWRPVLRHVPMVVITGRGGGGCLCRVGGWSTGHRQQDGHYDEGHAKASI
jgi:hypothetical protein